ncbi:DUF488 domain-containing protein [Leptospira langatensis]|uniref:DUF488 domain-containing protein n=1 Tax=Leptospira langatensis TaxID=2484983 RepID=A0A5F1ZRA8_9LEPT|nr:DUF488 domain-containing protein [Leptospira langatensis]TGK02778.1 DUF488 domain-containing protein [Leptospira langatensis]TGL40017.1 DUF488 domain-containing protein [Leptospira langatensis]
MKIQIKRVYEAPSPKDGKRILVDRLWPRGISKEAGKIDLWLKEISPSNELRKWYGHDPEHWAEFKARYFKELRSNPEGVEKLKASLDQSVITFLYSAKNTEYNNAVALREFLSA